MRFRAIRFFRLGNFSLSADTMRRLMCGDCHLPHLIKWRECAIFYAMISYWQQENGRLVKKSADSLNGAMRTWVDARCVTRDEVAFLEQQYGIDPENTQDILDPDELSRIDQEDNYVLIITRLPVFAPAERVSYFAAPLGIILQKDTIITICWTDCEVLRDFAANRVRELSLNDFPYFIVRILSRSDMHFLRYLKEINRRTTSIQNELLQSVENAELLQLMNLETSLVYFSTSLKSNQLLLEKLTRTKLIKLDTEDQDWIEDVKIDNKQAIEMTDTYTDIMAGMNDTFASIISNNLNILMKRLTIINLVMMVPTFVTGFFGMNVDLPFTNMGVRGIAIITMICVFLSWVAYLFFALKPGIAAKRRRSLKQLLAQRKEIRRLRRIERSIQ